MLSKNDWVLIAHWCLTLCGHVYEKNLSLFQEKRVVKELHMFLWLGVFLLFLIYSMGHIGQLTLLAMLNYISMEHSVKMSSFFCSLTTHWAPIDDTIHALFMYPKIKSVVCLPRCIFWFHTSIAALWFWLVASLINIFKIIFYLFITSLIPNRSLVWAHLGVPAYSSIMPLIFFALCLISVRRQQYKMGTL